MKNHGQARELVQVGNGGEENRRSGRHRNQAAGANRSKYGEQRVRIVPYGLDLWKCIAALCDQALCFLAEECLEVARELRV